MLIGRFNSVTSVYAVLVFWLDDQSMCVVGGHQRTARWTEKLDFFLSFVLHRQHTLMMIRKARVVIT